MFGPFSDHINLDHNPQYRQWSTPKFLATHIYYLYLIGYCKDKMTFHINNINQTVVLPILNQLLLHFFQTNKSN